MIDRILLGRAIAELRADRSQRVVAQRAEVSVSTWNGWEKGKRLPRDRQFKKIFHALGCTEEALRATVWRLQGEAFFVRGSELGKFAAETLASCLSKVERRDLNLKNVPDDIRAAVLRLQEKIIALEADLEALALALSLEDYSQTKRRSLPDRKNISDILNFT